MIRYGPTVLWARAELVGAAICASASFRSSRARGGGGLTRCKRIDTDRAGWVCVSRWQRLACTSRNVFRG